MNMKSAVAVLLAGAVAVSVGCTRAGGRSAKVDNLTPRTLVVTMDRAIAAKDYDTIAQCIAPDYRRPFRDILSAAKEYFIEMDQTATLIEQRIDPAVAQRLRKEAAETYHGLLPSPLDGAVQDNKIQWDRVQIEAQERSAVVEVDHKPTLFFDKYEIVQVKNRWYVAPDESAKRFSGDAKRMVRSYREFTKILQRLQDRIRKGQVTRQTIEAELWPPK